MYLSRELRKNTTVLLREYTTIYVYIYMYYVYKQSSSSRIIIIFFFKILFSFSSLPNVVEWFYFQHNFLKILLCAYTYEQLRVLHTHLQIYTYKQSHYTAHSSHPRSFILLKYFGFLMKL